MTLDWQVLFIAFAAVALRLVVAFVEDIYQGEPLPKPKE